VDVLDTRDELIGKEEDGLQGEFAVAEVEKILQAGSEQIKNHSIVVALSSEPANKRDTDSSSEGLVNTSLIFELWMLRLDTLKLDSNLLSRYDVGPEIDVTKRTTADLTTDAVFVTDAEIHSSHLELNYGLWVSGSLIRESKM